MVLQKGSEAVFSSPTVISTGVTQNRVGTGRKEGIWFISISSSLKMHNKSSSVQEGRKEMSWLFQQHQGKW